MSITPFGADGALDAGLLRAHLRFLGDRGASVYVASQGSGEGDLLSVEEKLAVYDIAADELDGTCEVVAAGIGLAMSTAAATALAAGAEAAGVDGVQIIGPRPGPRPVRADELERWFRTLIEAVSCTVHLSTNAVLTGYEVPVELIEQLVVAYDHVHVVNVSTTDADALLQLVTRLASRVEVRVGMTAQLARAHAAGASGLLSFEANVAPALAVQAAALLELDGLLALNAVLSRGGNPRSLKAALAILGRDGGTLRPPYLPLTPDEHAALAHDLAALGIVQAPNP
jgi:dihydrodipicolinate synthase/N-acetylneuraminate lyase